MSSGGGGGGVMTFATGGGAGDGSPYVPPLLYVYLIPGSRSAPVARTVAVSMSVMVDVDADGKPIGVEVLDGSDWTTALTALAMQGRVRIV